MNRAGSPKIMLVGRNGQVGRELCRSLAPVGQIVALDRTCLDLTKPDQIRHRVREIKPDIIINAAAYTAVDKAEHQAELALAVNGSAPGILAEEAKRIKALLIHYSTDYVFDGTQKTPYAETDLPNPLNVYGRSKLAGERTVQAAGGPYLILRISWVYGLTGKNFLLTILRLAAEKEELRVVDDQIGSPTWSRMIAEATAQILALGSAGISERSGVYHLSAGGKTSWYGFAKAILGGGGKLGQHPKQIIPISTSEYPTAARRPANSVLSNERLLHTFGLALPVWDESLKLAMDDLPKVSD